VELLQQRISNISDVPRSKLMTFLKVWKRKIHLMKLGKPIKFVAINPEEVV
jgi:sugar-specific transcriptional regulator TrmB